MATLGKTGIEVSKLCFGTLTMTPFQANLSIEEGASLLVHAYSRGVNFFDTAEIYDNYQYLRKALETIPRESVVIATKAYAYDEKTAIESLDKALKEIGTEYIDLFLLHEQESVHTLRGHHEALKTFQREKEKGKIRAVGISSHFVQCVEAAYHWDEIEVVHPIINMEGIGIADGTKEEMLAAIKRLHEKGVGIYSMKALGGGHLIAKNREALHWILEQECIDSVAIGMQSMEEVDYNVDFFLEKKENRALEEIIQQRKRKLVIADYCIGCGNCVKRCKQQAMTVVNGKAQADDKCILCGYCATVCPEFCIKVV